jgi:hypothetical protein
MTFIDPDIPIDPNALDRAVRDFLLEAPEKDIEALVDLVGDRATSLLQTGESARDAAVQRFQESAKSTRSEAPPARARRVARNPRHKLLPSLAKASNTHTQGLFFRRAAFDAYVICRLAGDPNLGRTKIEKITHLVEYHCGLDFEREPLRDAAGPVDYNSRRKVESLAKKQDWYTVVEAKVRWGVKYVPGPKLRDALLVAIRMIGAQKARVDTVIDLMRPLTTRTCEIIATLFAAWNDLLLKGERPNDDEIVTEARENWHPKKLTIPVREWAECLTWLRAQGVLPKGVGKPVRSLRGN